ncbi:MAG: hypothetical protein JO148_16435 [Acidimicrobiia bacterium]|nr:hypothetical protein [Acidimicrobiia bacterium]
MSDSSALQAWRHRARHGDHERRRPPVRTALAAAAAAGVGFTLFGRSVLNGEGPAAEVRRVARTPPVTSPTQCPPIGPVLHADVDGDGCDEQVTFADGLLTAGSLRMHVGGPGDQIALGRWTCGGVTVALLRPSTGEVFRFDGWATQGASVSAVAAGRIEDAVSLEASPRNGGRCDDLVVTRASGPPVLLPERPVAG